MKVLIIDDDRLMRLTLTRMLRVLGHVSVEAEGVQAALPTLRVSFYDVVVTDLHLEDGSGYDVLTRAREAGLPAIIMSGSLPEDLWPGVVTLEKPFTVAALGEALVLATRKPSSA